jgi:phytoene dehydrogenase-like protein
MGAANRARPPTSSPHPASRPAGTELGYCDDPAAALFGEPEAVDDTEQQRITEQAELAARERRDAARRRRLLLDAEERLRRAVATAHNTPGRRLDITDETRLIRKLLNGNGHRNGSAEAQRARGLEHLDQLERRIIDRQAA